MIFPERAPPVGEDLPNVDLRPLEITVEVAQHAEAVDRVDGLGVVGSEQGAPHRQRFFEEWAGLLPPAGLHQQIPEIDEIGGHEGMSLWVQTPPRLDDLPAGLLRLGQLALLEAEIGEIVQ